MKPSVLFFVLLIWTVWVLSAETVRISDSANKIDVLSSSASETILQYTIGSFERGRISINEVDFYHLRLFKEGITLDKGYPELPVFNRSIIIGNTARMRMEIYDITYQDFQMQIAPSKGVITRDINPETVPYTFGDIYQSKEFYPSQIAVLSEPYILREFRGITIRTIPFAYNPATKTLRVYTGYKVRVYAEGIDDVNVITTQQTGITQDFIPIYENQFLNWDNYRYTAVNDTYGKLLIIYYDSYLTQITPYVDWKKQKGIPTELVAWSTVGSNANQLQTYIQNRYNADNAITYVQLVGDAPQIPTLSSSGGGSDPSFSLVAGSDNYPDIFVGRFSAQTTTQVTDQINKVIAYERDLNTTATWLNKAMGIASADGGGGIGDLNESDITHMNYIRTDLLNYGYATVDQIYDPAALATTVSTNVNAGRGFINYAGHGSATSWGTTGFSSANATNLTNGNMLPVIMSVACQNGNFVNSTCFAEAWLRNGNGGAVAMYASSIDQPWSPPMRAQDEVTDLLIAESKTTIGGLFFNGSCKMMDIYGNTTGSSGVNTFSTWNIFGDASLQVRSKIPQAMTVTHPIQIPIGTTTVSVSTGVANALVAITYNNTIYGRGYTNSSGNATITLNTPPSGLMTYTITATAFNRVTYVSTIQQIQSNNPPVITLPESFSFDKNGSLQVSFSAYVSDPDGNPLSLSCNGNSNVFVAVSGLNVTFTAAQNWTGTEIVTFTVSDGSLQASDNVQVTVNQVAMPVWTPVVYPQTATINLVVTIDGATAGLNDVVGAFAGSECRGMAEVTFNNRNAFVSLQVYLNGSGEIITLKVFNYGTGDVYPVQQTFVPEPGEVIGGTEPVPITATYNIVLATPTLTCAFNDTGMNLQWQAVPNADYYKVYRSFDPFGSFDYLTTVTGLSYFDTSRFNGAFYIIKAFKDIGTR